MAERISPESKEFKNRWFRLRKGFLPWFSFKSNPYRSAFFRRYQWVEKHAKKARLLDVPCGMGWGTSLIKGTTRLVGLDLADDAVVEAQKRYGHLAEFRSGSMASLPFDDGEFDVVACLEGIEHVPKEVASQFIQESYRVLSSNGKLLLSSPHTANGEHSGNPYHVHEYTTEEITELLATTFSVEDFHQRKVDNLIVDYFVCLRS